MPVIKCCEIVVTRATFHFCNNVPLLSCVNCKKPFCVYHARRHRHLDDAPWAIVGVGKRFGSQLWANTLAS